MVSGRSDAMDGDTPALALKILVAGGCGVAKTTLVGAVSEVRPLRTEEVLSEAGRPVDDTDGIDREVTTTVAMDFGRSTVRSGLSLARDREWGKEVLIRLVEDAGRMHAARLLDSVR
ncbi:hypothetical protein GTW46_25160 [Streptomyces sp. SID6013]|nr:hypothetical protein [Streptomyces sp. SID6013]